jgi:hypothetical protein
VSSRDTDRRNNTGRLLLSHVQRHGPGRDVDLHPFNLPPLFFLEVGVLHPVFIGGYFEGLVRDGGSSPRQPGATSRHSGTLPGRFRVDGFVQGESIAPRSTAHAVGPSRPPSTTRGPHAGFHETAQAVNTAVRVLVAWEKAPIRTYQ